MIVAALGVGCSGCTTTQPSDLRIDYLSMIDRSQTREIPRAVRLGRREPEGLLIAVSSGISRSGPGSERPGNFYSHSFFCDDSGRKMELGSLDAYKRGLAADRLTENNRWLYAILLDIDNQKLMANGPASGMYGPDIKIYDLRKDNNDTCFYLEEPGYGPYVSNTVRIPAHLIHDALKKGTKLPPRLSIY